MFRSMICLLTTLALSQAAAADNKELLYQALGAQPAEVQQRYDARHPGQTLEFFGIEPGMTVMEGLPGGGWYSRILLSYLGAEGQLIGADYAVDMYPLFGFFSQEILDSKPTWVADWAAEADGWRAEGDASVAAFQLGSLPEAMHGTADAVVMVRAFHNLARFEDKGAYLSRAIKDTFDVLKPGGVLGIVQHEARADMPDDWANGQRGYLKKSFLVQRMEQAGFVFEAESPVNENPNDVPTDKDIVWRLPPTLAVSGDNAAHKARMLEIGESNRMTLRFRKPE